MAELSTLARPYARAAFEFAVGQDEVNTWAEQLKLLATLVVEENVAKALASPSLSSDKSASIVIDVCGDELTASVQNFVKILAENKRLALLPFLTKQFNEFKANREKSVEVELISAQKIDKASESKLVKALSDKLKREVKISTEIDKDLIGGVIIRAADIVIDGSVRGRLAKLAKAMNS
jgi:F-type H+-transporting ATPase subunit delta